MPSPDRVIFYWCLIQNQTKHLQHFCHLLCLSLNHYISFGSWGCTGPYISCKSRPTIWGFCNLLKGTTAVLWRCPSHSKLDLQWVLNWEPPFLSIVPYRMGYNRPLICILCFFLTCILRNVLVNIILSGQLYMLMVARLCLHRAVIITFDHPSLHLHSFTCSWHSWCHRVSHAHLKFSLHSLLHQRRSSRPFAVQDIAWGLYNMLTAGVQINDLCMTEPALT